jgi:radical SAM protein with 4Fe4S-binding SPASM domain
LPPALVPDEYKKEITETVGFCSFPNILALDANGNVAPCDGLLNCPEYILGNVRRNSLKKIWYNSKRLKKIKSIGREGLKGVCGKCRYNDICMGGCRAAAYLTYGSFRMPDPVCQKLYSVKLFPKNCLR